MTEKTSAGAGNQRDVRALQIRYAATCLYSVLMSKIRIIRTKMTPKGFQEIVAVIVKNVFSQVVIGSLQNMPKKSRREAAKEELHDGEQGADSLRLP